jgi:hypothetical protein
VNIENKERKKMKKIIVKATFKADPSISHVGTHSLVNETAAEFLARWARLDPQHIHEIVGCVDMTEAEVSSYRSENCAADYYAVHGSAGEF